MSRMNRISRLTSLRTNRLRFDYANRLSQNQDVDKVERIEPIDVTKTSVTYPSENYLLSYERYYEKLVDLKKEFKKFYHHEQELYQAIKSLDEDESLILSKTSTLITKFNQVIQAIIEFDKRAGTTHSINVRSVYQAFSKDLAEIGVLEEKDGLLTFSPDIFVHYLQDKEDSGKKIMETFKKMILKEYRSFMSIRLLQDNPYEQKHLPLKGIIIEEEW